MLGNFISFMSKKSKNSCKSAFKFFGLTPSKANPLRIMPTNNDIMRADELLDFSRPFFDYEPGALNTANGQSSCMARLKSNHYIFYWGIYLILFIFIVTTQLTLLETLKMQETHSSPTEENVFGAERELRMVAENQFDWVTLLPALRRANPEEVYPDDLSAVSEE